MARATDATLKMLGYSATGIPSPMEPPWEKLDHVGIRIGAGSQPADELLSQGQKVVIYDPHRGTVPSYGEFTTDVYPLPRPEHGCDIAIGYRADGWIDRSERAPKIGAVLGAGQLRKRQLAQGSYRGLRQDEYDVLVAKIRSHAEHRSR